MASSQLSSNRWSYSSVRSRQTNRPERSSGSIDHSNRRTNTPNSVQGQGTLNHGNYVIEDNLPFFIRPFINPPVNEPFLQKFVRKSIITGLVALCYWSITEFQIKAHIDRVNAINEKLNATTNSESTMNNNLQSNLTSYSVNSTILSMLISHFTATPVVNPKKFVFGSFAQDFPFFLQMFVYLGMSIYCLYWLLIDITDEDIAHMAAQERNRQGQEEGGQQQQQQQQQSSDHNNNRNNRSNQNSNSIGPLYAPSNSRLATSLAGAKMQRKLNKNKSKNKGKPSQIQVNTNKSNQKGKEKKEVSLTNDNQQLENDDFVKEVELEDKEQQEEVVVKEEEEIISKKKIIPPEIWIQVMEQLGRKDLNSCMRVCKTWVRKEMLKLLFSSFLPLLY